MQALGMIETRGLVPAIEALDAMLKSADVTLVEKTIIGGGLVTITVTGDVSAVHSAVDAGTASVERFGEGHLVTSHIIARPHEEVAGMFDPRDPSDPSGNFENSEDSEEIEERTEDSESEIEEAKSEIEDSEIEGSETERLETEDSGDDVMTDEPKAESDPESKQEEDPEAEQVLERKNGELSREYCDWLVKREGKEALLSELEKTHVTKLRSLARTYPELGIAGREISRANKSKLMEELRKWYQI